MNYKQLIFISVALLLLMGCGDMKKNLDDQKFGETSALYYDQFPQFPDRAFKTLALNQTQPEVLRLVSDMALEQLSAEEVYHFYFQKDSTELIIPVSSILIEFKVFLRSKTYLDNEGDFRTFLSSKAEKVTFSKSFSVYYYSTPELDYKITYFRKDNYIRLHFLLLENHS